MYVLPAGIAVHHMHDKVKGDSRSLPDLLTTANPAEKKTTEHHLTTAKTGSPLLFKVYTIPNTVGTPSVNGLWDAGPLWAWSPQKS